LVINDVALELGKGCTMMGKVCV